MDETDFSMQVATELPDSQTRLIQGWLRDFNRAANPEWWAKMDDPASDAKPLCLVVRDARARVIGGLFGETSLAWLKIHIMALRQDFRRRGLGSSMLALAEQAAVARGCRYCFLDTMEYQAPEFYRGNGYEEAARIPDWDSHGHAKYYFTKRLVAAR